MVSPAGASTSRPSRVNLMGCFVSLMASEAGAEPIIGYQRENRNCDRGNDEDRFHRADHGVSLRSPRKRSSALTSTVSKRSRMRNTKTPNTMKARERD